MTHYANLRNRQLLFLTAVMALIILTVPSVYAQRTILEPGFNMFSVAQDVELGEELSKDAEDQLPMLNNAQVDDYLNRLGKKLAMYAPGAEYPYQFKCVNDDTINAFALPGGFLFINRGVIEAADNEAELAGVIGHEIGHVALRHGTNQASKAQLAQAPLAILGGLFGNDSTGAALAQLGAGFAMNSILLKYSRDAERQADLIGTQILFDAHYNPKYMAEFFEKLDTGGSGTDFFSSHPNPGNRMEKINVEISRLGRPAGRVSNDSREFRNIKRLVKSLPPAPNSGTGQDQASSQNDSTQPEQQTARRGTTPPVPSSRFRGFFSEYLRLRYPDNWKVFGQDMEFTLSPSGGIIRSGESSAMAYGASVSITPVDNQGRSDLSLEEATKLLMDNLQRTNPSMRLIRDEKRIKIDGRRGLLRIYENKSPAGGREINWVATVMHTEGLVAFVFVVPEQDYGDYRNTFEKILDSVDFR